MRQDEISSACAFPDFIADAPTSLARHQCCHDSWDVFSEMSPFPASCGTYQEGLCKTHALEAAAVSKFAKFLRSAWHVCNPVAAVMCQVHYVLVRLLAIASVFIWACLETSGEISPVLAQGCSLPGTAVVLYCQYAFYAIVQGVR